MLTWQVWSLCGFQISKLLPCLWGAAGMLHAGTTQLGCSSFMTHPICADKRIRSNLRHLHNEGEQKIGWREHTECLWWPLKGFFNGKTLPWWKQEEGLQALHSARPHLNRNVCILVKKHKQRVISGTGGLSFSFLSHWISLQGSAFGLHLKGTHRLLRVFALGKRYFSPHTSHPFSLI